MAIVVVCIRFENGGRVSVGFIPQRSVHLAIRPSECASAHLSCDGKAKVRAPGTQFVGMKEFEKDSKEVLGGVIAGQRRERADDLARGAMNGRNEDQQQEPLPHRLERRAAPASQKIEKDIIGRGMLVMVVLVLKFPHELERVRERGQYWAGDSK